MNKVCVYLVNENEHYLRMTAISVGMLRKKNTHIHVRVFLIRDKSQKTLSRVPSVALQEYDASKTELFIAYCKKLGVEVVEKPPVDEIFHVNRSYFTECTEDQVLFIDGDTFVYNDVELIFNSYPEYDLVSMSSVMEDWLKETGWPGPEYLNSSIILFNKREPLDQYAGRLLTEVQQFPTKTDEVSKWVNRLESDIVTRFLKDEVIFTLMAHTFKYHNFDLHHCTCINRPKWWESIIAHTFSHYWENAFELVRHNEVALLEGNPFVQDRRKLTLIEKKQIQEVLAARSVPPEAWSLLERLFWENEDNRRRATDLAWTLEDLSSANTSA